MQLSDLSSKDFPLFKSLRVPQVPVGISSSTLRTENDYLEWLEKAKARYGSDTEVVIKGINVSLVSEKYDKENMLVAESMERYYTGRRFTND